MLGSLVSWLPRRRACNSSDAGSGASAASVTRVVDGHGVDFVVDLLDRIDLPCIRMHEVAGHPGPALHIRHDVDHSIDKAIMIAGVEAAAGYTSTYFLLTPGAYKDRNYYGSIDRKGRIEHDPELADKCRRLIDLGHDIGFHNDLVALSLNTGRPAAEILREETDWFDARGLHLRGMAAHGNPLCRRLAFNNRELFDGCVRKGWAVGRTIRHQGREVVLHSLDMRDFGLEYEAYSLPRDSRISESGGRWGGRVAGERVPKESLAEAFDLERFRAIADSASQRNGIRHMSVMTHPVYWNGHGKGEG